ncbi:1-(5-phosphoribosyl)-5-[(5-phosphoribosylamino)methylideneamino]imidazole-4-carboxamide isomerase [Candidatus Contubernalis alkaliaceticus]|uniref:1-(5-phosphoribosyl)-5-[(5- phosphoribosylamino)methylideneamino]imidazole-4- carboxamide isomerase n=1 Tax=Candidatus Contubernalis alkaliaceticus TaxID=338645 RepID=UPI001F4C22B7|nr:1-(5-phosphoribosyl)-5-[(5-phosphoribosylamino)methylideneamino]imidazole-4-carboxamide isomerase [Candidatus Contubernalis alkalaceticus]UNC92902.1 1-(5-phosphoribosyl)-5-[(5-phosphoribosylamino)methylideneamino]imidazole-4-carboxamide isomerase [Candidatus Contubernalis alkalaceticus]
MEVIPAIDLKGGKCVRLFQGRADRETVYYEDPLEVALMWEQKGASRLHLVDLDGAFQGSPKNKEVIKKIAAVLKIPIQMGGGIREEETVAELFSLGISKAIIGTAAVDNPDLVERLVNAYGERIMVGVDAQEGMVAVKGWVESSNLRALDLVKKMEQAGVKEVVYTDISRDGTLQGPNFDSTREIAENTEVKIIASGGVSSLEDIKIARQLEGVGISGIIVGQALYTGKFTLEEALKI